MRHRIHMLLDRSGSMEAHRRQTIAAVNGYIASLRADGLAGDTTFSLTTFDSESIETVRQGERGSSVRDLKAEEFVPRAATPLYDAVGHVIGIEARNPVAGRKAIVIVTDGAENGSRRLGAEDVRRLVSERERQGWTFIFLGANQDAGQEAAKVGVPAQRAISYRAGSGKAAAATFAAAAAVSFAYFTLKPGEASAATLGFSEADRSAAFDGAADWQAEMQKDIASAPSEPTAALDAADWSGASSDAESSATSATTAVEADGSGTAAEGESLFGTITSALGSIFSIFGDGETDSSDNSDSEGADSGDSESGSSSD